MSFSSADPFDLVQAHGLNAESTYLRLALDSHAIVSATDPNGVITYVNDKFCETSGYSREELIGSNHRIVRSGQHPPSVFQEMWATISSNRVWQGEVCNCRKDGRHYWVASTIVPFADQDGKIYQYISIRTDITRPKRIEQVLAAMSRAQSETLSEKEPNQVFADLLSAVLNLTDSPVGLIGEIFPDANQGNILSLFAVTSLSRNKQDEASCLQHIAHGMNGSDQHPLLKAAITAGKPLLFNNRRTEDDQLPADHPALLHFLSLPFLRGDQTVGLIVLANRPSGYDQQLVTLLEPMTNACANMIEGIRSERRRQNALAALKVAKDEAEKANHAKTDFLSRMSHELRTPLNAIIGFSQLMESDPVDVLPPSQQENVEQILKAGWHLLELIDEVLDLAQIETGKVELNTGPVDLVAVVDESLRLVLPIAQQRNVSVDWQGQTQGPTVCADRTRFKQVLINLLSNAIKYNHPQGSVSLTLHHSPSQVGIAVADTGRGIAQDELGKLFAPFMRVGDTSAAPGVGIGLNISRRFVELMGGRIDVTSTLGQGSTFTLWLPLALAAPKASKPTSGLTPVTGPTPAPSDAALQVLYIEDNPDNRQLLTRIFERHPLHRLHLAATGGEGIRRAHEIKPDLILLDLQLPDMSGYAVKQALEESADCAAIPVVALTANALDSDREQALRQGFQGFLTKPLLQHELQACLAQFSPKTK